MTIGPRVGRHALVMPIHSSTMVQITVGASAPKSVSLCIDTFGGREMRVRIRDVHVASRTWEEGENSRRK